MNRIRIMPGRSKDPPGNRTCVRMISSPPTLSVHRERWPPHFSWMSQADDQPSLRPVKTLQGIHRHFTMHQCKHSLYSHTRFPTGRLLLCGSAAPESTLRCLSPAIVFRIMGQMLEKRWPKAIDASVSHTRDCAK